MQLWVTSRELDNANAYFSSPFTEIQMRALTNEQLENYVEKVCKFYLSSAQVAKSEDSEENNATVDSINRESTGKLTSNKDPNNIEPDVASQKAAVQMYLEDKEILQEFSKFPLLMTMFVHIIASEAICIGSKDLTININSFSSLLICGTSGDEAKSVLKFLAKKGLWDVLVDCYYEVAEEAKQTSFEVINEYLSKSSNIDIDKLERKYHKKAAIAFCEGCNTNKVSVECMSFRYSDGHTHSKMVLDEFTKQITLPKMKQVLFVGMSISSDDTLIALIRMANDNAIDTLGFQNCSFPSNIETPEKMQALNKSINVE
ncbi:hypothetical protein BSL78_17716, partial [Apostichopus japonicus]